MTRRKSESTKQYIERWRQEYNRLDSVYSNLINEQINFSAEGFNHLIYSRGHRRPIKVIESRLPLIKYIRTVIVDNPVLLPSRKTNKIVNGAVSTLIFFTFMNVIQTRSAKLTIKVVVVKIGERGKYRFQSVMVRKIQPKKPQWGLFGCACFQLRLTLAGLGASPHKHNSIISIILNLVNP